MKLLLQRNTLTTESTIGTLSTDGLFECFTCEDVVRPAGAIKVHGKTAIPAGTYSVILTYSNRFKKVMPLLLKVPGFEGVRIHSGNTAADTEGCILVGTTQAKNFIGNSRAAYATLFAKMQAAAAAGQAITITIK